MTNLENLARTVLKNHAGDVEAAGPKFARAIVKENLLEDLARFYLQHVVAAIGDWPGQTVFEAQDVRAGSITVKPHKVRQHRRRTHAEREAAQRAMLASAEAIFELRIEGRAIGNVAMGELREMKHRLVHDASNKLMLGVEQVHAAVLIEMIEDHCQVDDQLMRVRDAISAKDLRALDARAKIEAPRRVELAMAQAAIAMEKHKELAA